MSRQQVEFVKTAGVKERIEAFTSQHFAFFVLALDCASRTCRTRLSFAFGKIAQLVGNRVSGHDTTLVGQV